MAHLILYDHPGKNETETPLKQSLHPMSALKAEAVKITMPAKCLFGVKTTSQPNLRGII
jgi:hypothetical protein